jgi:ATP-dependent Clp protease ATP-binding subunit ClpC
MKTKVMDELKRTFRPEFLNRLDETIVFHALNINHIMEIVDLMIAELNVRLKEQDLSIEITKDAKKKIAEEGYDEKFGARPLRRAILKLIEDKISESLLEERINPGDKLTARVKDGKVIVEVNSNK